MPRGTSHDWKRNQMEKGRSVKAHDGKLKSLGLKGVVQLEDREEDKPLSGGYSGTSLYNEAGQTQKGEQTRKPGSQSSGCYIKKKKKGGGGGKKRREKTESGGVG